LKDRETIHLLRIASAKKNRLYYSFSSRFTSIFYTRCAELCRYNAECKCAA